jgi:hypothetical protein
MKNLEHPELEPIDITGEVVPLPKPVSTLQKLVDEDLGYFNEDGEFCTKLPLHTILSNGFNETGD